MKTQDKTMSDLSKLQQRITNLEQTVLELAEFVYTPNDSSSEEEVVEIPRPSRPKRGIGRIFKDKHSQNHQRKPPQTKIDHLRRILSTPTPKTPTSLIPKVALHKLPESLRTKGTYKVITLKPPFKTDSQTQTSPINNESKREKIQAFLDLPPEAIQRLTEREASLYRIAADSLRALDRIIKRQEEIHKNQRHESSKNNNEKI